MKAEFIEEIFKNPEYQSYVLFLKKRKRDILVFKIIQAFLGFILTILFFTLFGCIVDWSLSNFINYLIFVLYFSPFCFLIFLLPFFPKDTSNADKIPVIIVDKFIEKSYYRGFYNKFHIKNKIIFNHLRKFSNSIVFNFKYLNDKEFDNLLRLIFQYRKLIPKTKSISKILKGEVPVERVSFNKNNFALMEETVETIKKIENKLKVLLYKYDYM